MGGNIDSIIKPGILSTIDITARHLTADTRVKLLGPALSRFTTRGTGKTLLTLACYADGLRVVFASILADGEVSDEEVDEAEGFLKEVAANFAKVRPEYAKFASLQRADIHAFINHYGSDSGPFGFKDDATKWSGVAVCQNIANETSDRAALDELRRTLLLAAETMLVVDGVNDQAEAFLDELKKQLGLSEPGSEKPLNDDYTSTGITAPTVFPSHWSARLAFHPHEPLLAISGQGNVTIWDLSTRKPTTSIYIKREKRIQSLAFDQAGNQLITYSEDDFKARVFDISSGERTFVLDGEGNDVVVYRTLASGEIVTTNRGTGTVDFWDQKTGQKSCSIQCYSETRFSSDTPQTEITYDGRFAVTCTSDDDDVRVFDVQSKARCGTFWQHQEKVKSLAASPTENVCVSIDEEGKAFAWRVASGDCIAETDLEMRYITVCKFSHCGKYVIAAGWSRQEDRKACISILNLPDLSEANRIPLDDRPTAVAISPHEPILACNGLGGRSEHGIVVFNYLETESVDELEKVDAPEEPNERDIDWDEDNDSLDGDEEVQGTFDPDGWNLATEGQVEWSELIDALGEPREASMLTSDQWNSAQAENRVVTIEHCESGIDYVGRVGLHRGLNLCRVVFDQSLPDGIEIVNVNVGDIDCNFFAASADTATASEELIDACLIGDLKAAKKAISSGANVNQQSYSAEGPKRNAITAAIYGGNCELVSLLLKKGIDSDVGWPLAMTLGHFEIADQLEAADFFVERDVAFVRSCQVGQLEAIKRLQKEIEDIDDSVTDYGDDPITANPLTAAAMGGQREVVQYLLEAGAYVNKEDKRNITAWVAAAAAGHDEICDILESNGADPDIQKAFIVAVDSGNLPLARQFIESGKVDVNGWTTLDQQHMTAVHAAIISERFPGDDDQKQQCQHEAIRLLLAQGATLNVVDESGEPLLNRVIKAYKSSQILPFLNDQVDVNLVDSGGCTALHLACSLEYSFVFPLLLWGADVNLQDNKGNKPLFHMFLEDSEHEEKDCDAVKLFHMFGFDLNSTDSNGDDLETLCHKTLEENPENEGCQEILDFLNDDSAREECHGLFQSRPTSMEELRQQMQVVIDLQEDQETTATFFRRHLKSFTDQLPELYSSFLKDPNYHFRFAAAATIDQSDLADAQAAPLLIGSMNDEDLDVKSLIRKTIANRGSEFAQPMLAARDLVSPDSLVDYAGMLKSKSAEYYQEYREAISAELPVEIPEDANPDERARAGAVMCLNATFKEEDREIEDAIELYRQSLQLYPMRFSPAWSRLATLLANQGDLSLQDAVTGLDKYNHDYEIATLEAAVDSSDVFPWAAHDLAWLLAADWDKSSRDGDRAVELAERACELTQWKYATMLDTCAAAYAEQGNFDKAIERLQNALEQTSSDLKSDYLKQFEEDIERYRNGKAKPSNADENDSEDDDENDLDDDQDSYDQDESYDDQDGDSDSYIGNEESIKSFLRRKRMQQSNQQWLADPAGTITNSIGMKLVPVEPGEFEMGEHGCEEGEDMQHTVQITKPFLIGMFPVTQGEYYHVMDENPSMYFGKNRPVEQLTWKQAKEFCERLSQLPDELNAGRSYRLPTEAEWEYACRAGSQSDFFFGAYAEHEHANFSEHGGQDRPQPTLPVGSFKPNAWGLYDTHGNVWEWCSDWFDDEYYENSPLEDPTGPEQGSHHVLRGGAASNDGSQCSAFMRGEASSCDGPDLTNPAYGRFEGLGDFGIRVVCEMRTGDNHE